HRIAAIEEDRMRHRRPIVLARIPALLEPHRAEFSGWRVIAAAAGGDWPAIALGAVDGDGHALLRLADGDNDLGPRAGGRECHESRDDGSNTYTTHGNTFQQPRPAK